MKVWRYINITYTNYDGNEIYSSFFFFHVYLFYERENASRGGAEGEGESKAGSTLSAQNPMQAQSSDT